MLSNGSKTAMIIVNMVTTVKRVWRPLYAGTSKIVSSSMSKSGKVSLCPRNSALREKEAGKLLS